MTSISVVVFIFGIVFRFLLFVMDSRPPTISSVDPGAQSGHETQFLLSDGEVRDSDADLVNRQVLGKFSYPHLPFSLCEIYIQQLGLS